MLAVIGTVPDQDFPLATGKVDMAGNQLSINGKDILINRGTPALLGAMMTALKALSWPKDTAGFIAGDIGLGNGSFKLYQYLVDNIAHMDIDVIVFHYL
ncbi:MAG: sugar kinase, partial [Desulfobacteraceae bacterium]|nr:sugar kinase [Desulfobacteraceae bacterium]